MKRPIFYSVLWSIVLIYSCRGAQDYFYYPIAQLHPGQNRISELVAKTKINAALQHENAVQGKKGQYILRHDDGKSIMTLHSAIPVIKSIFGYVVMDGHHEIVASCYFSAKTVPIKVIVDMSRLDTANFWKNAAQKGYVYPYDLHGAWHIPPKKFTELVDDPNRYFAVHSARKCKNDIHDDSIGAEYPLWIKVGKDIPFIEFMISDTLYKHGLVYDPAMTSHQYDIFVEKARKILREHPISVLKLVSQRVHYKDIANLCSAQAGPSII